MRRPESSLDFLGQVTPRQYTRLVTYKRPEAKSAAMRTSGQIVR